MTTNSNPIPINRRRLLQGAAATGLAALAARPLLEANAQAQKNYVPAQYGEPAPVSDAWKTGTKLVLLGTQGGPLLNSNRTMTAQAVVVNGKIYLFDFGYGALRRIIELGMPLGDVQQMFLTHHHSDHMMDLPAIMNATWATGASRPIGVYAPKPIDRSLKAAKEVFAEEYASRGAGGRFIPVEQLFVPRTLAKAGPVFQDGNIKVTSVQVPHGKFDLALGFRIEAGGRVIALSGDTSYSEAVVQLAKGADLLVHEAVYAAGSGTGGYIAPNAHTSSADAGRIAQAAGVKTLVLSHLLGGTTPVTDAQWKAEAQQNFRGQIVVARDRLIL